MAQREIGNMLDVGNKDNHNLNYKELFAMAEDDKAKIFELYNRSLDNSSGPTGPQGPAGPAGPQGPKGDTGPQGIQGIKGDTGLQGPKGDKGDTGPQGIQGIQGPTGPQGLKGDTGPAGPKGDKGDTGSGLKILDTYTDASQLPASAASGDAYFVGTDLYVWSVSTNEFVNQGQMKGAKGDTGPQGPVGPQGPKGDTGATGPAGADGQQGPAGPKGDTGPQGIQGVKGDKGDTGLQGPKGDAGVAGPQGIQGVAGPQGPTGKDGLNVYTVTVTGAVTDSNGGNATYPVNTTIINTTDWNVYLKTGTNTYVNKGTIKGEPGTAGTGGSGSVTPPSWITATLSNGYTGSVKYSKDALNIVTVAVDVTVGTGALNTLVASIPSGYLPAMAYLPDIFYNSSTGAAEPFFNIGNVFNGVTAGKALTTGHNIRGQFIYRV